VVPTLSGCARLYKTQIHDVDYLSDSQFFEIPGGFSTGAAIDESKRFQDKGIEDQVNILWIRILLLPVL
jgi:hypothetical protein